MADNIQVTEGSGLTVATDDVSGVHFQKVKIQRGTDGKAASDIKYAAISASSSGDNTIVAAVTSTKLRLIGYVLSASSAVNAKWKSGSGTDKSGLLYLDSKGGVSHYSENGCIETAAGEALVLNLSGAVAVGGHVAYVEEA